MTKWELRYQSYKDHPIEHTIVTDLTIIIIMVVTTDLETHQDIAMEIIIVMDIDGVHMVIIATTMTEENNRSNKRNKNKIY